MAKICEICEKRPQGGNLVSHARNRVKRWIYPNVQKIRYKFEGSSNVYRGSICTKCMKAGKVQKVI